MKVLSFLPLISGFCLVSACRGKNRAEQGEVTTASQPVSSALPGPERARTAAARVRPEMEKALAEHGMKWGAPVFLRAFKEEAELELWVKMEEGKFAHFRTWKIACQSGGPGPKLAEGDGQVPEGFYFVPPTAMKPDSAYHLAFNIGFPNAFDRALGRTGSHIMIHGNQVSIGCLAMTDEKIEEIYSLCAAALENGQPFFRIHLLPFRMTPERLAREAESPHFSFWQNLKEISDRFEETKIPPDVEPREGRYVIR